MGSIPATKTTKVIIGKSYQNGMIMGDSHETNDRGMIVVRHPGDEIVETFNPKYYHYRMEVQYREAVNNE